MSNLKDLSELSLSHDELMLKELERRDGIYSFIFHELESPKEEILDIGTVEQSVQISIDADSNAECEQKVSPPAIVPRTTAASTATPAAGTTAAHATRAIASMHNVAISASAGTAATASICFSSAGASASLSSALSSYQEYLKTWHPPPSLVYDNPKLYAYMANCGFRVRVPTPRFSHITVPLVRNRRHALKDSAEYKRCEMCLFKIPDLRPLFPHDPDVHAPFNADCVEQVGETLLK